MTTRVVRAIQKERKRRSPAVIHAIAEKNQSKVHIVREKGKVLQQGYEQDPKHNERISPMGTTGFEGRKVTAVAKRAVLDDSRRGPGQNF